MFKFIRNIVIVVVLAAVFAVFFYSYSLNTPLSANAQQVNFTVAPGQSVSTIAHNLQAQKLIRSSTAFYLYARSKSGTSLEAGNYVLSQSMPAAQIFEVLSEGAVVADSLSIRVVEGANLADIATVWAAAHPNDANAAQEFNSAIAAEAKTFDFFGETPKVRSLEGYLFPDTYFVKKEDGPDVLIKKMLANLDAKLTPQLRAEIKARGSNIYDTLTLASIIEREVGRNTKTVTQADVDQLQVERKTVAGIFYNRLAQGIALQSDATVDYVTHKNDPSASAADIQIDSPYNTYKYKGLPPGPIAEPSESSIIAAVEPTSTDYLYFLSKPDGTAVFAKTLAEQDANKNKYLK